MTNTYTYTAIFKKISFACALIALTSVHIACNKNTNNITSESSSKESGEKINSDAKIQVKAQKVAANEKSGVLSKTEVKNEVLAKYNLKGVEQTLDFKTATVEVKTNVGSFLIELNAEKAPVSVYNFMRYLKAKKYNNTIFHRVIEGFMIQGGGFTKDLKKVKGYNPIKNEAMNGLKNDRGTLAMARTNVPDSATNQFFINVINNDYLNFRSLDPRGIGYAVFGKVISGMDIVDTIAGMPTKCSKKDSGEGCSTTKGMRDVPESTVMILDMTVKSTKK